MRNKRLICIDSSNRPSDIPLSKWIEEGREYTEVARFNGLYGTAMVQLAEVDLLPLGLPYKGFNAERFINPDPEVMHAEEVITQANFV